MHLCKYVYVLILLTNMSNVYQYVGVLVISGEQVLGIKLNAMSLQVG